MRGGPRRTMVDTLLGGLETNQLRELDREGPVHEQRKPTDIRLPSVAVDEPKTTPSTMLSSGVSASTLVVVSSRCFTVFQALPGNLEEEVDNDSSRRTRSQFWSQISKPYRNSSYS